MSDSEFWLNAIVRQLPAAEGFYWWRETPEKAWRMVQVVDFAASVEDKSHLMTYDVQNHSWSGRSLKGWADHFPIGEWIHVPLPETPRRLTQSQQFATI
jgi:hypothetical protein